VSATGSLRLCLLAVRVLVAATLAPPLTSCATDPRSTAGVSAPSSPATTGSATTDDVEVVARTDAWRGWPRELWRVVVPVHVAVTNRGDAPLRVARASFALVVEGQRRLAAADPLDVHGVIYEPPPGLPDAGYGPGWSGSDWALQPSQPAPTWYWYTPGGEQFALPTPDMVERALPEGVLDPGRTARGFLYFERPPERTRVVELTVVLVDASSGEPRTRLVVPLGLR
jgi:hypothetical protein